MAQRFYTLDLQDTQFPLLSEQQSRTTIVPSDGEKGDSPSINYCHNVMPSAYGMDSVGYLPLVGDALSLLPLGLVFTDVRIVFGDERTRLYLAWDTEGNVYVLPKDATEWVAVPATDPVTGGAGFDNNSVTVATVNGISYIMYSGIACFTFEEASNTLVEAVLTGLAIEDVLGVVHSSGYLVAYTKEAVAWSSTLDPTDFVPSTVTGAGGGNVAGIAGDILFTVTNPLGLIINTAANAIAGTFTGNSSYPFKFREIDNSKGGLSLDLVAYEANSKRQFIFSKAGLQGVTTQVAENILPDVTDFLAGKRFEDFNETTLDFEVTDLDATATMKKKLKYIASRYVVISYGITEFTHALVYDTALQKLGKLRITHADVFEYVGAQTEISKESLAFVLGTGEVKVLDFSTQAASNGVLIYGKLQYSATRMFKLLGVELENVETTANLEVITKYSITGKDTLNAAGYLRAGTGELREYLFDTVAKNHLLVFKGKFNLVTALVRYTLAGRR